MVSVPPQLSLRETIPASHDEIAIGEAGGLTYLVVELPGWVGPCWVCAPATEWAIDCVRRGQASPWAVVHHSATGTVDVYRTAADGSLHFSTVLCSCLPAQQPERAAA